VLAATATAQREGRLGREHVAVIRRFYHQLPRWIDGDTRAQAQAHLAALGAHQHLPPPQATALRLGRGAIAPAIAHWLA
jgi:hypothetical protein